LFDLAPRKALGVSRFLNAAPEMPAARRSVQQAGQETANSTACATVHAGLSQQSQTFYQTICKHHAGSGLGGANTVETDLFSRFLGGFLK
jgi:hypothetical protein